MFDLSHKTALVTGASGGLGKGIARTLHAQGARVVLSGTRREALHSLADALGENAHVVPADLAAPEAAAVLIKEAEAALGAGIDVLINNAGVTRDMLALRMKDEEWETVLNLNLSAAFRLSRAVLKGMMSRRNGRIINITSVIGTTGNAGQANYAAAKAGLGALTRSLALEIASRNVTVNAIAPGFIATPMTDALTEGQKQGILARIPVGTFGTPEDVAAAVAFLASDEARYITGQTLHVNGGMVMV